MTVERAQRHLERLDIVVKASEIKWGLFGALERLVTPDLAAKFQRQWEMLSDAIMDSRHEDVITLADGAIRGVWKMDAEAIAAGHTPMALLPFGVGEVPAVDQSVCKPTPDAITGHTKEWYKAGGDPLPY